MRSNRTISYSQAIREAFDIALGRDPRVFLIGEGIPDPKGAFGTTLGLQEKYGKNRVMDMPVSEAGMTGVTIGAALGGMRPILTHMRIDFSLISFDQIVNTAAKWYYMFGGKTSVPLVIRMLIGRGWGQGPQHSQSLQALYAHVPGLKVVMPASAYDAKGLLLSAIADPNPVVFIEHRWLHGTTGSVPRGYYTEPIGEAKVVRRGRDITLVASSYMTIECLKTARILEPLGASIEVIDLRTVTPLDYQTILASVQKTGRLIVADGGWRSFGVAAEIMARVSEHRYKMLKEAPRRITLPDLPTPTSWALAKTYYPTRFSIAKEITKMLGWKQIRLKKVMKDLMWHHDRHFDTPDPTFTGPF